MCFYIDDEHNSDPRIADEDIICYKVGYRIPMVTPEAEIEVFISEYRDYIYQLNSKQPELQLNPMYDIQLGCEVIHQGYHSYPDLTKAKISANADQIIVKCIIPKGSTYYRNTIWCEYVSTSLIVTNFLID